MTFSLSMLLDERRMKRSGKYPIKMRLRSGNDVELFTTTYELPKGDFEKLKARRIGESLQGIRQTLEELEFEAQKAAAEIVPFCFDEFYDIFISSHPKFKKSKRARKTQGPDLVHSCKFDFTPYLNRFKILHEVSPSPLHISFTYIKYIKDLIEEGRIGSALNYQDSYRELKKFAGSITFTDITDKFLYRFERWMIEKKGISRTTVGIKLRSLRAVFSRAIDEKLIRRENCYPFGKKKYVIPASRNKKKALPISAVKAIYECEPDSTEDMKAKDYWLFCYFGNGMNPKDMAYLKFKDIDGDYITFIRAKTERATRDNPKPITVFMNDDMRRIIEKWGNTDKSSNNYIFPILSQSMNPLEMYNRIRTFAKYISDRMPAICHQLGIQVKVNNMVCRHTFSSVLKRSGVSTEYIQDALGHYDKKTTENYLDSFEKDQVRENSQKLLPI